MSKGATMGGAQTRKNSAGTPAFVVALMPALFIAAATSGKAHAENWYPFRDELRCVDLDSIKIANDARGETLITFMQALFCDPRTQAHKKNHEYITGVTRAECPRILDGDKRAMVAIYGPAADVSTAEPPMRMEASPAERDMAYLACRQKGAPDGLVVFENDMARESVVVYIDSTEACRLDAASAIEEDKVILPEISCDVNLRRFGSDPQQRHAVRIVAGWREANDTVSLSDCHWNWRGTKIFKIGDDRIHFDCM